MVRHSHNSSNFDFRNFLARKRRERFRMIRTAEQVHGDNKYHRKKQREEERGEIREGMRDLERRQGRLLRIIGVPILIIGVSMLPGCASEPINFYKGYSPNTGQLWIKVNAEDRDGIYRAEIIDEQGNVVKTLRNMDSSELRSWDRYLGGMETIPVEYRNEKLRLRITDSRGNQRTRSERRLYFPQKVLSRR